MAGRSTPNLASLCVLALALGACGASPSTVSPTGTATLVPTPTSQPTAAPTTSIAAPPSFGEGVPMTVGDGVSTISTGDLNADGLVDLVVSQAGGDAAVALGLGDGTFRPATFVPAPETDYATLADLTGDGILDLIAPSGAGVAILVGDGAGGFGAATSFPIADNFDEGGTFWAATGDLDGDGDLDVAVSSWRGHLYVLVNHGDGTFAEPVAYEDPAAVAVAMGDFDGDGALDLATANFDGTVRVLHGEGDGTLTSVTSYPIGFGDHGAAIVAGDVNGDGRLDLLTGNTNSHTSTLLIANASGSFEPFLSFPAGNTHSVAIADLDGDGHADLLSGGHQEPGVEFTRGHGDGTFETSVLIDTGPIHGRGIAAADFNHDGRFDLAIGTDNLVVILLAD